jgi:hypothetical protein
VTTLHKLADSHHLLIAINPVDRRNQRLLTSQSPYETISELPLVHQYYDWKLKEQLQNFYQKTELFVVLSPGVVCYGDFFFGIINFNITIFLSLLFPPALSLLFLCYNTLFALPTMFSAPSHPLSLPDFTSPSYPPQPVTTLPLPRTHSPPADYPSMPTVHNPSPCNP